MRSAVAAGVAAAVLAAAPGASAQEPIPPEALAPHLDALAGIAAANGGHRSAGTPGEAQTGDYAAARLAEAGWTISHTDVPFTYWEERAPALLGAYRPRRDFVALHYSGAGDVTARVRTVGGGGCKPRAFRRFPRGRIALVTAAFCSFRSAAKRARRAGARAVIVGDFSGGPPTLGTLVRPDIPIPVVSVRLPIARRLAERRTPIHLRVDAVAEERVTRNVLAELPGTEADEVVMAGAHMDGVRSGVGMNDNGSGVAALIEAGRRIAALPRGRRTVRLAFFAAHEPSMAGSIRYVRELPREERRRIRAFLNIDMVASPNGVPEIYSSSRRLRSVLERRLRGAGRTPVDVPSDHTPFLKARIPVAGIYTGSLEPKNRRQARRWGGTAFKERDRCYHLACDDRDNISLRMLSLTTTATAGALEDLAR